MADTRHIRIREKLNNIFEKDIALFETDQTLLDVEQPQQQTPQGQ